MKRLIISLTLCSIIAIGAWQATALAQVQVQVSKAVVKLGGDKVLLHQIRKGQTVYSIAKAYNVDVEEIYKLNPLAKEGLEVNRTLIIPYYEVGEVSRSIKSDKRQNQKDAQEPTLDREAPTGERRTQTPEVIQPADQSTSMLLENDTLNLDSQSDTITQTTILTGELSEVNPSHLKIALCLPFGEPGSRSNENFADFYKGFLLAMTKLKQDGISADVKLISSSSAVDTNALQDMNLIVGPVYEQIARPVVQYATNHGIAVVSPLSDFKEVSSPYLFQAAPLKEYKYDKLGEILTENKSANVIMILPTTLEDQELIDAVNKLVNSNNLTLKTLPYSKQTPINSLSGMLSKNADNIVIVPMNQESQVEQILSRISSLNTMGRYPIKVVGSSSWGKFENLNLDLFFKLSVNYVTSYHADRSSKVIRKFYSDYAEAFSSIPSLFSFRGYDVGVFFGGALSEYGARMPLEISQYQCNNLLDVKYNFARETINDSFKNREWMITVFMPNYTIQMK